MLFLGNITRPDIPYTELQDLSLRFLPSIHKSDYDLNIDKEYLILAEFLKYLLLEPELEVKNNLMIC